MANRRFLAEPVLRVSEAPRIEADHRESSMLFNSLLEIKTLAEGTTAQVRR